MFEEIKKLKDLIVNWLIIFIATGIFFFFFGMGTVNLFGSALNLPIPIDTSFSIQFFKMTQLDLLPLGVTLVAMGPMSALNTQTVIAFMLSFFITFPYLLYRLVKYVSPALYKNERLALLTVLLPAVVLFFGGCIFAYKFVIPPTFKALYSYTSTTGVTALFSMEAFVSTIVTFMIVTGVLFLLPIFMILLSFIGVIPASFWRDNWRYAQLVFLIFSAIITPDGSGVSMILLSLPLIGLYAVGVVISHMFQRRRVTEET